MTTTYTLSTDIGKVRLYTGDNNTSNAVFSDEELQIFIDNAASSNLRLAAAWALRTLARDAARRGIWAEARVNRDAGADEAVRMAKWLEAQAAAVDGVSPNSGASWLVAPWAASVSKAAKEVYEEDTDRVEPAFTRDLHSYE